MMSTKWIHVSILKFMLLSNYLALVRSNFHQFDESFDDPLSRYPTVSLKSQSNLPIDFSSYFVDGHEEIPSQRFGFDVVYGSPKKSNPPSRINSKFRSNLNYSFPDKSSFEEDIKLSFHQNYKPKYFSDTRDGFFDKKKSSNPLFSSNEDWSPEERIYKGLPVKRNYGKRAPNEMKFISRTNNNKNPQHYSGSNLGKTRYRKLHTESRKPVRSYSTKKFYKPRHPSSYGKNIYRDHHFQSHGKSSSKRFNKPFRPSSPDVYLNSFQNYEHYLADSSKTVQKFLKQKKQNSSAKIKKPICMNLNKSVDINGRPDNVTDCYKCFDKDAGMGFEKCGSYRQEVLKANSNKKNAEKNLELDLHSREKRDSNHLSRNKRQYGDYESEERSFEDDEMRYRFGPEHFVADESNTEETESSFESGNPDEKCQKIRDGNKLCISCESTISGGTYKQCSYASEPRRVSYDRSASTEYGSTYSEENDSTDPYYDTNAPLNLPLSPYPSSVSHHRSVNGRYADQQDKVNTDINSKALSPRSHKRTTNTRQKPISNSPRFTLPASTFKFGDHFHGTESFEDSFPHIFSDIGSDSALTDDFHDDDNFSTSFGYEKGKLDISNKLKVRRNPSMTELNKTSENDKLNRKPYSFSEQNKTTCKKLIKNHLTCYVCVSENGVKREKCSESSSTKNDKNYNRYSSQFNSTPNSDKTAPKRTDNSFFYSRYKTAQPSGRNEKNSNRNDDYMPMDTKYHIRLPRNSDKKNNEYHTVRPHEQSRKESLPTNQISDFNYGYTTNSYHSITTESPEIEEIPKRKVNSVKILR